MRYSCNFYVTDWLSTVACSFLFQVQSGSDDVEMLHAIQSTSPKNRTHKIIITIIISIILTIITITITIITIIQSSMIITSYINALGVFSGQAAPLSAMSPVHAWWPPPIEESKSQLPSRKSRDEKKG